MRPSVTVYSQPLLPLYPRLALAGRGCANVAHRPPVSLPEQKLSTQDLLRATAWCCACLRPPNLPGCGDHKISWYVAGGRPGQRLLTRLSLPASDDTVLRRVRQAPAQPPAHPPVPHLGVDDWAWRKGQNYGTILVNLDLHRVVALLPDRAAESFAEWLKQTSGSYDDLARSIWSLRRRSHPRRNSSSTGCRSLSPCCEHVVDGGASIGRAQSTVGSSGYKEREPTACFTTDEPLAEAAPRPFTQSQLRRQRRLDLYEQVVALRHAGVSKADISRQMKLGQNTILRWLRRSRFPERKPRHGRPPKVIEFAEYLRQRWNEGGHNALRLHPEIRAQGYQGKYGMVARLMANWRKAGPHNRTPQTASHRNTLPFSSRAAPLN